MTEGKPLLTSQSFKLTPSELSALFDQHTVREGLSNAKLQQLGAGKGLCDELQTNLKAGIVTDRDSLSRRIAA
jgi:hypothetical protein